MSFNTFCNICFIKENIIKLCGEENERIINILVSFTSSPDAVNGIIYLCTNCCDKLEEYDKFRELLLTNFVRFRYLYNEHKKLLEIRNVPDIESRLKAFIDVNVEKPSGTPLIENYEIARSLRYNTTSDPDITCKEYDEISFKIDLENLIQNDDLMHIDTGLHSEINVSKNETWGCDTFNEDEEKIQEIIIKSEPSFDEASHELSHNTKSIPCYSSAYNENCNASTDEHTGLEKVSECATGETNPERFDESEDPVVCDTVANVSPRRELEDDDISVLSFNPGDTETDDTTNEEGATDEVNKKKKIDLACNVCDKRFSFISGLERHVRTHSNERPFHCDECQKTFRDKSVLMRHKRSHSGEKPYKCEECGFQFRERALLIRHHQRHSLERPYSCDQCQKTFTRNFSLTIHKRTHTGEKPYKCDECGLKYTKKFSLLNHKRTHSGVRPFHCEVCQKTFTYRSHLIVHERIHIDEKQHMCDKCGLKFLQSSYLKKHKRTHIKEMSFSSDETQKNT